jgi:Holliday junction DNA helicase RuvA
MIGRLSGTVASSRPDEVVIDVHGVGYVLHIPLSTFYRLTGTSGTIALYVHTHVREDAIQLFGFWTEEERSAFQRLISISGIGPKIALAVLSGVGVPDLERAVRAQDRGLFERIPGIGRKTAERMLLELKDRPSSRRQGRREIGPATGPEEGASIPNQIEADATSALMHLGYQEQACTRAMAAARRDVGDGASLEEFLRAALRSLVRSGPSR